MKRLILLTLMVCGILAVSCSLDYKGALEDLQSKIEALNREMDELDAITANLGALRDVLLIGAAGDPIVSVNPDGDSFDFTFKNNGTRKVGTATGGISVGYDDGGFFWTLGGVPLKDESGNNASIEVSPKFRVNDDRIEVSTDGGNTWSAMQPDAERVNTGVQDSASSVDVSFLGGTTVSFAKDSPLQVLLSGDSSMLPTQGRVIVDYCISGGTGNYTVATSQGSGWSPQIIAENGFKGQIVFVASGSPVSDEAKIFVSDEGGHMSVTTVSLSSMAPDENFPLMHPAYDAYNVPCGGGVVEVIVSSNLDYEVEIDPSATSWLTRTSTRAVREDNLAFSATANDDLQMRFAEVTLTSGLYTRTVMICQDGKRPAIGQNLSENGTANCYIVPAAGDYYFDATVIGNGQDGIIPDAGFHTDNAAITPSYVEIMSEFSEETLLEDLRLEDGKVCFQATGEKGNLTVIVFDDDDNVLWSWHLWFTDIPLEKSHTNDDGHQFTLLDRNLGATSADPADGFATYGLMYQWGRKDPFSGEEMKCSMAANAAGTINYGVIRPFRPFLTDAPHSLNWHFDLNDHLWGNPDPHGGVPFDELVKTIYDPCPAGYMVPPANAFVLFRDNSRLEYITNGIVLRGDYGQTSFFPYAGRAYQGSWEAFGYNAEEICMALWNSDPGIYNTSVYDGASCLYFRVSRIQMSLNHGDFRARGIPVRCVKQSK